MPAIDLTGRVALVAGASRGIGAAVGAAFAHAGANVGLAARDHDALARLAGELEPAKGTAIPIPANVTSPEDVAAMVKRVVAEFGRLDFACNNAAGGGHPPTPLAEVSTAAFDSGLAVSLRGVFLCLKNEIPAMLATGAGAIVNISTTAGIEAVGGLLGAHTVIEMAFEIDHVGAVVHVAITARQWSADATLFAVSADGTRIAVPHPTMGAAGPSRGIAAITKRYTGPPLPEDPDAAQGVLDAYRVQRRDVEDALNQLLGRDPEMHRPPRLSWDPLIDHLAEHGVVISEEDLIAMPFRFEFSPEALAALEER